MVSSLVVGGNGFIGSHLVDTLSRAGHEVSVFDRFSTGPRYEASGVRAIKGDFANPDDVRKAVDGHDEVFHFLSLTTPASAESDPGTDLTNVANSVQLMESCVEHEVERLYFASTGGAIYGDQERERLDELSTTMPISPYGIGKLATERYLAYFRARHGLRSYSLRLSNPFGPRQNPHRPQGLVAVALDAALNGSSIRVIGDGSTVRDYIYVGDLVEMVEQLVGRPGAHEVYNLGSSTGHTVNDILGTVERVTGRTLEREYVPMPTTYVNRVVLDTSRFTSEFTARPHTALEDGIAQTWAALRG